MGPRSNRAPMVHSGEYSAYSIFDRRDWAALRSITPLPLSNSDLDNLRGLNEPIMLDEVADILLPLSRLLNLHVAAARKLGRVQDAFLNRRAGSPPYIIAVAGSVAVGKSTLARVLRLLLARWPDHPRVELVTTDGFLHPNRVLEQRGLMQRKGFPESYDLQRMVRFLAAVKAGEAEVTAPVYSHHTSDIVPDEFELVRQPDVLIFEGLNVLQQVERAPALVSDFFDFSVYLDAEEADRGVVHRTLSHSAADRVSKTLVVFPSLSGASGRGSPRCGAPDVARLQAGESAPEYSTDTHARQRRAAQAT